MQKNTVILSDDGMVLSDGMVCSPYGRQCCSELMLLHPPGEGPQLCFPELSLICWAPSSLMDCKAQLLKFFSSLDVTFCGFCCVPLGCSSSVLWQTRRKPVFSQEGYLQVCSSGTRAVGRFTTGPTPLVGLGGFYTPWNMFVLQRQSSGNGLHLPSTEKQGTDQLL